MVPGRLRAWYGIHKWTSLVCTAFLLMLCLTGLPLVFHDELDELLGNRLRPPDLRDGPPHASLEAVIAAGLARHPGWVVQFVVWDRDEPDVVLLNLAARRPAPRGTQRIEVIDARTALYLGERRLYQGALYVVRQLHKDMFAGLAGSLVLGAMGLLFTVSLVSGVVLYGPFMKKLPFGAVRHDRTRRIRWLDLHNLLGIVSLAWLLVVGLTGVINTLADPIIKQWQATQIAVMTAPYRGRPAVTVPVAVDRVLAEVRAAMPEMTPAFIAFPGMPAAGPDHYLVSLRGAEPLTARLPRSVLVDAATARVVDRRDPPWYVALLLFSQPLHFGDYGGLPLKIIWALLDLVSIVMLGSGLYLWLARKPPAEQEP